MKINTSEIPDLPYEGYYWLSDATEPTLLHGEVLDPGILAQKLPFVVEGHLYNKEQNISLQIRQVEGEYFIQKLELNTVEQKFLSHKKYLGAFPKDSPLGFRISTLWKEDKDELLENMPVLVPHSRFFTGFQPQ